MAVATNADPDAGLDKGIFFAALQASGMPMCLSDTALPDFPLVFVNAAFCALTGYAEAELLGRNCRFLQGEDTDRAVVARVRAAIAGQTEVAVELVNYHKDGRAFWNALYLSPVFDPAGKLLYYFASQMDVTVRKEAEAALVQAQRMQALGGLVSGLAHEFNNLMTVVVGSVEQARDRAVDDRQRQQLDRASAAARHAGRLTQQMLSFARQQFHDSRDADLSALVGDLDSLLAQFAGTAVTVVLDLAPVPLPVWVDSGQLELALMNLTRNAVDAMPGGGRLTLSTRARVDGAGKRWAALMVTDTGEGMAEAVVRQACEPFFTTKVRGKGTGLGLSMVSGFAEQSGGHLAIESALGRGTTITVALPCSMGCDADVLAG